MKIKIKVEKEVEILLLQVKAKPRYWRDSCVNGEEDTENGDNMPCKVGNWWCPEINIETGVILNWEKGKTASIHYKVCDNCGWKIIDVDGICVQDVKDEYVPGGLCPVEDGWGDYIIMYIDENGKIEDWSFDISDYM